MFIGKVNTTEMSTLSKFIPKVHLKQPDSLWGLFLGAREWGRSWQNILVKYFHVLKKVKVIQFFLVSYSLGWECSKWGLLKTCGNYSNTDHVNLEVSIIT